MALHDADKNNNDRTSPVVNAHDKAGDGRMAQGTVSLHPTTDASSIPGFLQTKNLRILANDGTTNRGLFGYNQAMGLWGFFLTKLGIDVNTNTDTSQFIFNSNQDALKVVKTGTLVIPSFSFNTGGAQYATGGSTVASTAHGLSTIPGVIAYWNDTVSVNGYILLPYSFIMASSAGGFAQAEVIVFTDATNVNAQVVTWGYNMSTSMPSINVKYYLLQETAN